MQITDKHIIVLPDISGMTDYLASFFGKLIEEKQPDAFLNVALSGGKTPYYIFENLRSSFSKQVNRELIRLFQVDERCVPPDHPESNYRMIRDTLLKAPGIPEELFFRMMGEKDPGTEAIRYGSILSSKLPLEAGCPVLDMILLGLGTDGHTASLFPGDENTIGSEQYCEVVAHPQSGQKRITLTLKVINRAKHQIFLVTGKEKAEIVSQILQGPDGNTFPAGLVSPVNGCQYWLLDKEAGSLLKNQG